MSIHVLEFVRSANDVWNLPTASLEELRERFPGVRFTSPATQAEADGLLPSADVVLGAAVSADNFGIASRLRWIHITAAGVGSVLFPQLAASDVVLTNGRGLHAEAMSEHAIGVMLAFTRRLHLSRDAQRERRWIQDEMWRHVPPSRLAGTTMLLVGLGAVGSAIATRARALGVRVIAVRRNPAPDPAPADEQHAASRLSELIPSADWVILAAPLTSETRRVMGAAELARMKPGAVLVNLGRGALVDEPALVEALRSGTVAGAALDVFEAEPLPAQSPLWDLPQVLVTPHVSGLAPDYWGRAIAMFGDNLGRFLEGRPLRNVVDKRAGY